MVRNRDAGDDESSAFASTSFVLSALFLAGVIVAAIVLVAGRPHASVAATAGTAPAGPSAVLQSTTASPTAGSTSMSANVDVESAGPAASSSALPIGAAPAGWASSCGLPGGGQEVPVTAPTGTWQIVAGIAVPISPVFGPGRLVGGIGACYAHNPTGALFAMMDTLALTEAPSDQIPATAVVTQRGSRTAQYTQALAAAQAQDSGGAGPHMPSDPSTTPKMTLLGFRFVDYTPARATIAVAVGIGDPSRSSTYQPAMVTAVVTWEGGDWKFVYSAQTGATAAPIISTEQYTAWAA